MALTSSPIIYTDSLPSNSVLNGSIRLLNTLATPEKDITIEVREEGTEHQFFYLINGQDAPPSSIQIKIKKIILSE
jgi:hypothetical protein